MIIGLIIILIPLIIYVSAALSVSRKQIENPDDFFVAFKKIGVTAFSSSSVAYNFQVSTIYPFLLWSISNFYLIPSVNTFCAGLGILLFYCCYPRYKKFIGKDITLHGILGETHGGVVRVIASYMTITAFLGFAISETYFGSKVMLSFMPDKNMTYLVVFGVMIFVYGYIAYGGQLSSIRTDQLQLMISYLGVFGLMLYLLYLVIINAVGVPVVLSWGLLVLSIYIIMVFILRRFRFIKFSEHDSVANKLINNSLNALVVLAFILLFIGSLYVFFTKKQVPDAKPFFNIEGFGVCGLLSLIVLPLSFQFVDLSNWQRLLSVKGDESANHVQYDKNIKRGLLTYAFESPFTWVIFIFFGLLTITALPQFTFQDLLADIPKRLINSPDHWQVALGYVFILSIVSIMLSTIDSFLMGIVFTFVYDAYPRTRRLLDKKDKQAIKADHRFIINAGKVFGLIIILLGVVLFIVFDKSVVNGGEMFINLLLSFYAAQLGFLPHILGILFLKKHPAAGWAIASMVAGSVSGIGLGIYAVIAKPEWAWYPILVCLATSFTIYASGLIFKKKS
jgi:hypothetical protein